MDGRQNNHRRLSMGLVWVAGILIGAPTLQAGHLTGCAVLLDIQRTLRRIAIDQAELALRQEERVRVKQDLAQIQSNIDTWTRQFIADGRIWIQATQTERTTRSQNVATGKRIRHELETSTELTQLLKGLEEARAKMEKIQTQILAPLKRSQEYQQVRQTIEKTRSKIKELHKAEKPDAKAVAALSQWLLKTDATIASMESKRLRSSEPYINAKESYEQLKRRMIAIRTEHDAALKQHPEILKARQTYQTSQTDLRNAKGQKYQSEKQLKLAQASALGVLRRARDIDARIAYLARAISSREARLRQLERVPAIGCICQLP